MHHDSETTRVWRFGVLGATLLVIAILGAVKCFSGCDSQKPAQVAAMREQLAAVHKVAVKTQEDVEGDGNVLTKVHDNSQKTLTNTIKIIEQQQMNVQRGMGVMAKQIEKLTSEVNNTHNSTWMILGVCFLLVLVIAALVMVIFWVVRKLFSIKFQVQRALDDSENTLDADRWEALKPSK